MKIIHFLIFIISISLLGCLTFKPEYNPRQQDDITVYGSIELSDLKEAVKLIQKKKMLHKDALSYIRVLLPGELEVHAMKKTIFMKKKDGVWTIEDSSPWASATMITLEHDGKTTTNKDFGEPHQIKFNTLTH